MIRPPSSDDDFPPPPTRSNRVVSHVPSVWSCPIVPPKHLVSCRGGGQHLLRKPSTTLSDLPDSLNDSRRTPPAPTAEPTRRSRTRSNTEASTGGEVASERGEGREDSTRAPVCSKGDAVSRRWGWGARLSLLALSKMYLFCLVT